MDNLQNITEATEIIGGADGPTAIFLAGRLGELSMGIMIATIVIGLLFCFLGHKLIKVISALLGLCIGFGAGFAISSITGMEGMTRVIIIFGCAVVLAALLFFLYRAGIFLMTFSITVSAVFAVVGAGEKTYVMAAFGVAVVLGIVTGLTDNPFVGLGIAGALAAVGMIVQFILYSKKKGRKEKGTAKRTKKKDVMESEVEKARMLLDDDEDTDD